MDTPKNPRQTWGNLWQINENGDKVKLILSKRAFPILQKRRKELIQKGIYKKEELKITY